MTIKILIVDDEAGIRDVVRRFLQKKNYKTIEANNGKEAVSIVKKENIDLVLIDQIMPKMDGITAFQKIRQIKEDLPVIMMTAHGSLDLGIQFIKKGGADFLEKPFALEILQIKLEQVLRECTLTKQLEKARKLEVLGTLAQSIAHDFNNVLFPIMGYAEIISNNIKENSPLHKHLNQIFKASERAKSLITQIQFFKPQAENEKIPLQLKNMVKEVIRLLYAIKPHNVKITSVFESKEEQIFAIPSQIHQIIMNLAINAFHAMPEGGCLTITLNSLEIKDSEILPLKPGLYLELIVSDNGEGIPPEIIDKIFIPFFTTKDKTQGSGLGLSNVQKLVKQHDGHIEVKSELGRGSHFHLYFPATQGEYIVENKKPELPGGSERLLVIDNDQTIAFMMQELLSSLGYIVHAETDALTALKKFSEKPDKFDMVITDQIRPDLPGTEIAEKIWQLHPQVPILLCTGLRPNLVCNCSNPQNCRTLNKPVSQYQLAKSIREMFDDIKAKKRKEQNA